MVILFNQPHQSRSALIVAVVLVLVIALVGIYVAILPPAFLTAINPVPAPAQSNLSINFDAIDSGAFKDLEVFSEAQIEFAYIATDASGQKITGSIMASTKEIAKSMVEQMGFKVSSIEEKNIGRSEPFQPYY